MFIGITSGLLLKQAAFGFVTLLGAMSLSGAPGERQPR
jgi:hypothetical protein